MGDKRSHYLGPEARQSSFIRNLMTGSPTVLLGEQLQPSRPSSPASSVKTESIPGSPIHSLPSKVASSPLLSVNSSLVPHKSVPGSPTATGASKGSFHIDDDDDIGSLLADQTNVRATYSKRGRSASINVPMLRVTTTDLSTPQSPRILKTSDSAHLLTVDYPTKVPDTYFGKAKRVERTNSFPLRRQQAVTLSFGEGLEPTKELDRENTTDTTSAYDTDTFSYEETVSNASSLHGRVEQGNKADDSKSNEIEVQGKSWFQLQIDTSQAANVQ